jgi:hypothetical protein
MGTMTAQNVMDKVITLLSDQTNIRWTQSELLGWINDGVREVALHKPEACVKAVNVVLTPSTPKQSIPADGTQFLKAVRNTGSDGTKLGRGITICDKNSLDGFQPTWYRDSYGPEIVHFMFDPENPRGFYVYPKAPSSALNIEVMYSYSPADVAAGSAIPVDDIYANALVHYTLFRCYSKDADYTNDTNEANRQYQLFASSLGIKHENETIRNPNLYRAGFQPDAPAAAK